MPRRHQTRRQILQLGAAVTAATMLRPPGARSATCGGVFEMPLDTGPGARVAGGWHATRVYEAPRRFDLIGLRWPRHARVEAQVRARRRGGSWTPWVPLHPNGDHAPDDGRAAAGSDPVFTGAADLFQLRLRGGSANLRARFVRALPDARRARASVRAARARSLTAGGPAIIPRADWGAASCAPRSAPSYGQVHLAFVHHTVSASNYTPQQSAAIVLGICRYHRDTNRWSDIGYNFLVDKYGQIFEGRAGGVDQAVVGAQAQGYNSLSTGVAVLGDYTTAPLTEAGLDALASLLAWKLSLHGVPVEGAVTVTSAGGATNRYPSGRQVTFQRISGHRDGNSTACPGNRFYPQLPELRARAAKRAVPVDRLTLRAAATSVQHPARLRVNGRLRFGEGTSAALAPIELEITRDGVNFAPVGRAMTESNGAWQADLALPYSGSLRARFLGDGARPAVESARIDVKVIPRVTLKVDPVDARARRLRQVTGTWRPQPPSGKVTIEIERRSRRGWRRKQRRRIVVNDGKFAAPVRVNRTGTFRMIVKGPGGVFRRRRFRSL